MVRVGRYTAALTLTIVGVLLLLDHAGSLDAIRILRVWWPAALVGLGLELIIMQSVYRKPGTRVRLSFGTLLGAVVLGGFVLIASRGDDFDLSTIQKWTESANLGLFDSVHAKHAFDKESTIVAVDSRITIQDANGKVTLKQGPTSDIEVAAKIYVDISDAVKADQIAEKSGIQVSGDDGGTRIVAHGEPYGTANIRKPRIDIIVTFPQDRMPELIAVDVGNGAVQVDGLEAAASITLDVKNGDVEGERIGGAIQAKLFNGDIKLAEVRGDADVDVVNGNITINRSEAGVSAKTVHGDIGIRSNVVGGHWRVASTLGDIKLAWPESVGVEVAAKTEIGNVNSDWPLKLTEHSASGKLGDGAWKIDVQSQMDITLERGEP